MNKNDTASVEVVKPKKKLMQTLVEGIASKLSLHASVSGPLGIKKSTSSGSLEDDQYGLMMSIASFNFDANDSTDGGSAIDSVGDREINLNDESDGGETKDDDRSRAIGSRSAHDDHKHHDDTPVRSNARSRSQGPPRMRGRGRSRDREDSDDDIDDSARINSNKMSENRFRKISLRSLSIGRRRNRRKKKKGEDDDDDLGSIAASVAIVEPRVPPPNTPQRSLSAGNLDVQLDSDDDEEEEESKRDNIHAISGHAKMARAIGDLLGKKRPALARPAALRRCKSGGIQSMTRSKSARPGVQRSQGRRGSFEASVPNDETNDASVPKTARNNPVREAGSDEDDDIVDSDSSSRQERSSNRPSRRGRKEDFMHPGSTDGGSTKSDHHSHSNAHSKSQSNIQTHSHIQKPHSTSNFIRKTSDSSSASVSASASASASANGGSSSSSKKKQQPSTQQQPTARSKNNARQANRRASGATITSNHGSGTNIAFDESIISIMNNDTDEREGESQSERIAKSESTISTVASTITSGSTSNRSTARTQPYINDLGKLSTHSTEYFTSMSPFNCPQLEIPSNPNQKEIAVSNHRIASASRSQSMRLVQPDATDIPKQSINSSSSKSTKSSKHRSTRNITNVTEVDDETCDIEVPLRGEGKAVTLDAKHNLTSPVQSNKSRSSVPSPRPQNRARYNRGRSGSRGPRDDGRSKSRDKDGTRQRRHRTRSGSRERIPRGTTNGANRRSSKSSSKKLSKPPASPRADVIGTPSKNGSDRQYLAVPPLSKTKSSGTTSKPQTQLQDQQQLRQKPRPMQSPLTSPIGGNRLIGIDDSMSNQDNIIRLLQHAVDQSKARANRTRQVLQGYRAEIRLLRNRRALAEHEREHQWSSLKRHKVQLERVSANKKG